VHPPSFDDGRPPFDHAFARELIGKLILVNLTIQDRNGEQKRYEQFHGVVTRTDAYDGVYLALKGLREGETKWLPPATHVYTAARKGEYRLQDTGEIVIDPDFTTQWIVTQPDA
jgi:hypothetical protein